MNEQQEPYPLAQVPMLMPALREHSASAKQVPDSSWSLWQAVFWYLSRFIMPATETGRKPWPRTGLAKAKALTASNNNKLALYMF